MFCLLRCTIFKIPVNDRFTIQVAIGCSFLSCPLLREHSIHVKGNHRVGNVGFYGLDSRGRSGKGNLYVVWGR